VSIYTVRSYKTISNALSSLRLVNISQKSEFSADAWKCWDSELGHEDCLAANSRSTGPPQRNTDDHDCPVDTAERSSSADWRTAGVGDWRRRQFMCNWF